MEKPYAELTLYHAYLTTELGNALPVRGTVETQARNEIETALTRDQTRFIIQHSSAFSLVDSLELADELTTYVKEKIPGSELDIRFRQIYERRISFQRILRIPRQRASDKPQLVELLLESGIKPLLPIDTTFHVPTEDTPETRRARYNSHIMCY